MKKKKTLPWWHDGEPDIRARQLSTRDLLRIVGKAQSELTVRAHDGDADAARGTWSPLLHP